MSDFYVKINGLEWDIICVHNKDNKLLLDGLECLGVTYFQEQQIYLNKDTSKKMFRTTVIHELVHAFLFSYGYHLDCNDMEEAVCDFLGSNLDRIYRLANKIVACCYK